MKQNDQWEALAYMLGNLIAKYAVELDELIPPTKENVIPYPSYQNTEYFPLEQSKAS